MKKILFFLLLSIISYNVFAQAPSKKCPTCGQSMAKCQYKGKHTKQTSNSAINNSTNGHEYVDLGLSVKWATCNIGATKPSDYGRLYCWGETQPKKYCFDKNYKFHQKNGDSYKLTKYEKTSSSSIVTLEKCDDTATANWGNAWRMPTAAEYEELYKNCTWADVRINGHRGVQGTSKINGKKIFFPAAGFKHDYSESWAELRDECCIYFSSQNTYSGSYAATIMYIDLDNCTADKMPSHHDGTKSNGCSVRAVKVK